MKTLTINLLIVSFPRHIDGRRPNVEYETPLHVRDHTI